MIKRIARRIKRLGHDFSRFNSPDFRAETDLFHPEFMLCADWRSGLEDGGHLLYGMTRCFKPKVVVEIGSARGKSSCSLALACKENGVGKVYAIDPHMKNPWTELGTTGDNEQFLRARLKEYDLEDWCEVIRDTSTNAAKTWDKTIDLIFIDGSHSYEGVKSDFDLFQPWFSEKALVIFHDSTWDYASWEQVQKTYQMQEELGVPRFLEELKNAGYQSITFPAPPGITILDPRVGGYEFLKGKGWPEMQAKG